MTEAIREAAQAVLDCRYERDQSSFNMRFDRAAVQLESALDQDARVRKLLAGPYHLKRVRTKLKLYTQNGYTGLSLPAAGSEQQALAELICRALNAQADLRRAEELAHKIDKLCLAVGRAAARLIGLNLPNRADSGFAKDSVGTIVTELNTAVAIARHARSVPAGKPG